MGKTVPKQPFDVSTEAIQWMQDYLSKHPGSTVIPTDQIPGKHRTAATVIRKQREDPSKGITKADLDRFVQVSKHYTGWQLGMSPILDALPKLEGVTLVPEWHYNQIKIDIRLSKKMPVNCPEVAQIKGQLFDYLQSQADKKSSPLFLAEWSSGGTFAKAEPTITLIPLNFKGTASHYGREDGFDGRGTAASTHRFKWQFSRFAPTLALPVSPTGLIGVCRSDDKTSMCIKNDWGPHGKVDREADLASDGLFDKIGNGSGYIPVDMLFRGIDGHAFIMGNTLLPGIPRYAGTGTDDRGNLLLGVFTLKEYADATLKMLELRIKETKSKLAVSFVVKKIDREPPFYILMSKTEITRTDKDDPQYRKTLDVLHKLTGLRGALWPTPLDLKELRS